jgi:NAD(P)-dependent dehydrogenase (short-subunit alcohol dehydrogenase family)
MVVPGLHSFFAGLDVSFHGGVSRDARALRFAVISTKARRRLVRIYIRGGGLEGSLETMNRALPVSQPSMAIVKPLVAKDEFAGSTALVVGGSRGLGELTAKLIAAGGGRVVITYAAGKSDAEAIAQEIRGAGGECETEAYDVRRTAAEQLAALGCIPTHLYYFATPMISRRKADLCDLQRLAEFNSFYIAGFLDVVKESLRRRPDGIAAFYPSSVYVEDRPAEMTEYAMSKAAAEILCADMQRYLPKLRVLTARLPRMATDQTSAVAHLGTANPIETLLPILRKMHSGSASRG